MVAVDSSKTASVCDEHKNRFSKGRVPSAPYMESASRSTPGKKRDIYESNDLRVDNTSFPNENDDGNPTPMSVNNLNFHNEEKPSAVRETMPDVDTENKTEVTDTLLRGEFLASPALAEAPYGKNGTTGLRVRRLTNV